MVVPRASTRKPTAPIKRAVHKQSPATSSKTTKPAEKAKATPGVKPPKAAGKAEPSPKAAGKAPPKPEEPVTVEESSNTPSKSDRMLNYLKYRSDPKKNKRGTKDQMLAASSALQARVFV